MKVRATIIIILSIIFFSTFTNAESSIKNSLKDTIKENRVASTIPNKDYSSDNISLSKKEIVDSLVNRNTTENTLAIFITALGVLFTVMAIVVAIVIFMQSRDFKNKLTEATDKYELIIKQFIESKREDLKIQEEELTKFISEYREKLESSQPEQKGEIKQIISQLETKKSIVEKQLNNSVVDVGYVFPNYYPSDLHGFPTNRYHKCSTCNFGFLVRELGYLDTAMLLNPMIKSSLVNKVATCPQCGNVDMI